MPSPMAGTDFDIVIRGGVQGNTGLVNYRQSSDRQMP